MEYSGGRREEEEWKSGEDTAGMGRLYECVFCKRGFTTAQALGGHMNIHRKDRAKTSTNTNTRPTRAGHEGGASVAKNDDVHGRFNFPAQSCYVASSRVPVDYCGWNLSLQVGPSSRRVHDDHDDGSVYDHDHDQDQDRRRGSFVDGEELDLELRLGHGRP